MTRLQELEQEYREERGRIEAKLNGPISYKNAPILADSHASVWLKYFNNELDEIDDFYLPLISKEEQELID